jgi:hypothetical protein
MTQLFAGWTVTKAQADLSALWARFVPPYGNNNVFNVRDYGATGLGVVDDFVAVQSAYTAAALTGGTVRWPPGTYKVGTALTIAANVATDLDDGVSITGAHPELKVPSTSSVIDRRSGMTRIISAFGGSATDVVAFGRNALSAFIALGIAAPNSAIAIGRNAAAASTSGDGLVAIGQDALAGATGGHGAIAIGAGAFSVASNPLNCVAIGYHAGYSLTNGSGVVCIGDTAGGSLTSTGIPATGTDTVAIGSSALASNQTGYQNTVIGANAGLGHLSYNLTAIGAKAGLSASNISESVAIGVECLFGNVPFNQVTDGTFMKWATGLPDWTLGAGWTAASAIDGLGKAYKSADGVGTLTPNPPTIDYAVGSIYRVFFTITDLAAGSAVTLSFGGATSAPYTANGNYTWDAVPTVFTGAGGGILAFTPTGGSANTSRFAISHIAFICQDNANGTGIVAVGVGTCYMNTSASYNTGIGNGALRQQGTGGRNTAVGVGASAWNGNGGQNTAIGMYSNATGNSNNRGVFLGYASGYYETADDRLWIDNRPRASNADGRLKALVYGVFDALTTNQLFRVNGQIESPEGDLGLRILTADAVHMPAFRGRQITGSGVATLILTSSYGLFVINNVNTGAQALVLHSYSGDVIVSQSAENEFVLGAPGAGKTGLITTAHNLTLQASAATTGNLFGASMMAPSTV